MGTLILHTLTSGCRKLVHPNLRQSSQKQHENAEEWSPSARPSPAVPKASPRASYACRMRRGVQLHLAGWSALRIGRRPRAAVTIFVAGTRTNSLTGAKARRPWTPSSIAPVACGPCSTTWVAEAILHECCQASMSRVDS